MGREENVIIKEITSKYNNGINSYSLKTDKGTFYFKDKTREGKSTVAFQQLQQFNFKSGDAVRVSFTESGMNTFTNRPFQNLMKFVTTDQNTPAVHTPQHTYQVQPNMSVQQVPPAPRWNAPAQNQVQNFGQQYDESQYIPIIEEENSSQDDSRLMDLTLRVQALEDSVRKLSQTVSGHGTLLVGLRGEKAVDLHTSFKEDAPPGMSISEISEHFNPNN